MRWSCGDRVMWCGLALIALCMFTGTAVADNRGPDGRPMLKNPFRPGEIFKKDFATDFFNKVKIQDVENEEGQDVKNSARSNPQPEKSEFAVKAPDPKDPKSASAAAVQDAPASDRVTFDDKTNGPLVVRDFKPEDLLPPDQVPQVRLNPDAPPVIFGMVSCMRSGDKECAERYADAWVKYQQNFFFEVREMTQLIGEALIRQGQIDDEEWRGVPQFIDHEFAQARVETKSVFRPSHDVAMQRIKADTKNQAAIYYFFNFNCAWCRKMAPDMERLYQAVKGDPNVKIVGLTLGPVPKDWLDEYRSYTGLTMPVMNGEAVAKAFGVRFTPALVVVAPTDARAYRKTGAQSFSRIYEFVRRVQGLPATLTPEVQRVAAMKIGEIDNAKFLPPKNRHIWVAEDEERMVIEQKLNGSAGTPPKRVAKRVPASSKVTMEKF